MNCHGAISFAITTSILRTFRILHSLNHLPLDELHEPRLNIASGAFGQFCTLTRNLSIAKSVHHPRSVNTLRGASLN